MTKRLAPVVALLLAAAFVLLPALAQAQISRVQTAQAGGDGSQGTSIAPVFGSNVVAGNYGIVCTRNGGNTLTGITDSLSTTYTQVGSISAGADTIWMHYGKFPSSGANTVTAAFSATSYVWVFALEVSGLAASSVLDTFDTQGPSGTTDLTTDPITTSQAEEYLLLCASQTSLATYTAGADFTLVDGTIPTNAENFGGVEERILSSTLSSYTPHFTSSNTTSAIVIAAAFKGAGGGGGGGGTPRQLLLLGVGETR